MSSRLPPALPAIGRPTKPYVYPPVADRRDSRGPEHDEAGAFPLPLLWRPESAAVIQTGITEEEAAAREKQAYARGAEDGFSQSRAEYERSLAAAREAVGEALRDFTKERETYFQRIEAEVVRLALGIARKILRRESQLDPGLLAGIVHVALEKFEAHTEVTMHVHPSQRDVWQTALEGHGGGKPVPTFVADESLSPDQCVLETRLGAADIGLEPQLQEIERGFFDLLAQRPDNPR